MKKHSFSQQNPANMNLHIRRLGAGKRYFFLFQEFQRKKRRKKKECAHPGFGHGYIIFFSTLFIVSEKKLVDFFCLYMDSSGNPSGKIHPFGYFWVFLMMSPTKSASR